MPDTVAPSAPGVLARSVAASPLPVVMVVDPDVGVHRMMARVLNDSGCTVAGVLDGETALAQLRAGLAPALVVSEVRLPGISGSQLARVIRSGGSATRVVLMSAYPRPPRGAEDEFLQKPLRIDRLVALVAEAAGSAAF